MFPAGLKREAYHKIIQGQKGYESNMAFKKDFAWGVATASYQIEGAYREGGKGLSIWDVFSHDKGRTFCGHTGDVACDHYHRFREDIALMKQIGVNSYRFSISWPRIIPDGTGKVNEEGLRFYSELVDELIKNGIEPYITLYHWDLPYELHKRGGWLNPDCTKWFARYAAVVVSALSDRVKNFITFNEPQCFIGLGYLHGEQAPGLKCMQKDIFAMSHNVLKAHGSAVIAMREAAKQPIRIGYAPTGTLGIPVTESEKDIKAAWDYSFGCSELENWTWNVSWWSDPVFLGHYPEDALKAFAEYLPEITDEDLKLISQPIDFYGQNIYHGTYVKAGENGESIVVEKPMGHAKTAVNWPVTPECLRWGTKFLHKRYGKPVYITENGMAAHDAVSLDGKVHDPNRSNYIERYLSELEKATDEGADIGGYFHWSFMDNYEWSCGYAERFGLVYVDYETQERIIKDSAMTYRDFIEKHR